MDIKQSYIMSIAGARLSLYEQRLIVKAVQSGQRPLQGVALGRLKGSLDITTPDTVTVEIDIRDICNSDKAHYEYVRTAAESLTRRTFTYIDTSGNWVTFGWVMRATHTRKSGKIRLLMDRRFYETLYNFAKGYSHYDLERALSFKLPSTTKLYCLLNGNRHAMTYTIQQLKHICGVSDKYARNNDFIRKVIAPAYDEIKADKAGRGGNYWEYHTVKEQGKITGIQFVPVLRATTEEQSSMFKAVRQWLPEDYHNLLLQHAGFTNQGLTHHKELLHDLATLPVGMEILLNTVRRARQTRPANMQGYIIATLRAEVKAYKEKGGKP